MADPTSTTDTDTAVITAHIMNAPLEGVSQAEAAGLRARLMADKDFAARAAANGIAEGEMLRDLWLIERGRPPPSLRQPESIADVLAAHGDRAVEQLEEHARVLDRQFDLTPQQQWEVLMRRPVYSHEKTKAANEYDKNTRDADYMQRWRNGGRRERTEMYLLNAVKAAPTWSSAEEAAAWDAANPFVGWEHT